MQSDETAYYLHCETNSSTLACTRIEKTGKVMCDGRNNYFSISLDDNDFVQIIVSQYYYQSTWLRSQKLSINKYYPVNEDEMIQVILDPETAWRKVLKFFVKRVKLILVDCEPEGIGMMNVDNNIRFDAVDPFDIGVGNPDWLHGYDSDDYDDQDDDEDDDFDDDATVILEENPCPVCCNDFTPSIEEFRRLSSTRHEVVQPNNTRLNSARVETVNSVPSGNYSLLQWVSSSAPKMFAQQNLIQTSISANSLFTNVPITPSASKAYKKALMKAKAKKSKNASTKVVAKKAPKNTPKKVMVNRAPKKAPKKVNANKSKNVSTKVVAHKSPKKTPKKVIRNKAAKKVPKRVILMRAAKKATLKVAAKRSPFKTSLELRRLRTELQEKPRIIISKRCKIIAAKKVLATKKPKRF